MRDAKFLIEKHFYKNPLFKELNSANECRELLSLMSKTHQNIIEFCYIKGAVLYFALKHPLALSELKRDSNINMIKALLKMITDNKDESVFKSVVDIKFFVIKQQKFNRQVEKQMLKTIKQKPKSEAKFINNAKDEIIYKKFEELREILKVKNLAFR